MDNAAIVDDTSNSRFLLNVDGQTSELVYRRVGGRLVLVHTEVPESLGGRGLGGRLVTAALEAAASKGLIVVPVCPYVRKWLSGHPDEAATAQIDWKPVW
jgi:predicted GNAT family acetyltransferase